MQHKNLINNSDVFLCLVVAVSAIFWFGVLKFDATPYGDGRRIAPFVKMLDQSSSLFLMWSPRNNGEPTLASPEHFYILGYLLEFGSIYNIVFNLILFLSLIGLSVSAYLLARSINIHATLSFLYASSVTINGLIVETERSARVQAIAILTCTLLVNYFFIRNNRYANIAIPMLIAISIYNGIHYSAITITSLIIVSFFHEHKDGLKRSLKLIFKGVLFSLPFLLPVIFHPILNGFNGLEDLKHTISTVNFTEFLFPHICVY